MKSKHKFLVAITMAGIHTSHANAQNLSSDNNRGIIQTSFPSLLVVPEARAGAMGEAGVATIPDANSGIYNAAKFAFVDKPTSFSLSYSPWLKNLSSGMSISCLSAYHHINDQYTIAASLRYLSIGNIDLTDDNGAVTGNYRPNEFAFDATIAKKYGDNFSLAATARYIRASALSSVGQNDTRSPNAFAIDASAYLKNKGALFGAAGETTYGLSIANIGTKVRYSDNGGRYFLPANLRLGAASAFSINEKNKFTVALDLNKLLVPSPSSSPNGNDLLIPSDKSVPSAIFSSFSDAPGGFSEELKEVAFNFGTEYLFNNQLALRAGYVYENPAKGIRRYLTLGAGYAYQDFTFDFAYLAANQQTSPLANTLRFTLTYNLSKN
ncbi:type IX secretion system outer membrane channel protein PorV [Mucilaginibacter limnophilus]|uniref:Type IX secretion system outer membrane channel protein PorV n=1 Tax=Mucilaginibacter limnophilus TaxID=1932778 RepID=A0A3S2V7I5_9SPHI|nr:type IX secretion system outer membrane channel protein PorV [Mucilaginibacter limnophilus]RVU00442.1 type IX secretion system outer membrane channel protein PorV [Mucilaginibacter limnophilus]